MIIYKITNKLNGRVYVGQTVMTVARRWTQHTTSKKNSPLYNAFRRYGKENFELEVICSALSPAHLNDLERYFIDYYNSMVPNGYNLTSGGDSAFTRSQDTRDKQSLAMMGHEVSQATRDKIAASLTGRPGVRLGATHTDEAKAKISEAQTGRKLSNETKIRMSEAHRGDKAYNAKPVECVETGTVYPTATDAARALNLIQSSVSAVCLGKRKSTGKLTFRYKKAA